MTESLIDLAKNWLAADPDPVTRAATQQLIESGDEDALRDHFGARLQFGTAGMRGALGPGPNRMNQVLVRKATAGLGAYVRENTENLVAVVGFDGRHGSRPFASDAAAVLASMGFVVYLFDEVIPTPGLAHAVTALKAATGVMVTASHNPPADNGYKVYWDNGAQIIPPHDKGISAAIDAVDAVLVPDLGELRAQKRVLPIPEWVAGDYLDRVLALRVHKETGVRAVYTAMHGVGWEMVQTVCRA
ncbi:MAG: phospho-sugar mutase, partial [Proteobacteria bacterium]|nr:phospho-sugar mutase [Pseudomonadota bacterium]